VTGVAVDVATPVPRLCPLCGVSSDRPFCPDDGVATITLSAGRPAIDYGPGDVIGGRYRLDKKVAQGGYGAVFRAHHVSTGETLGIKLLTASPNKLGDDAVRRFFREARETANLQSPHTVGVTDVGQDDGDDGEGGPLYLAMQWLDGESLDSRLERAVRDDAPPSGEEIATVGIHVLRSLDEAHRRGIVHRDVKPANIMLCDSADGLHAIVVDFGVAHVADSVLTETGRAPGTPKYMPPEYALGQKPDHRADIYALGVVLYECMTGCVPFVCDDQIQLLRMHGSEPAEDPRGVVEGPAWPTSCDEGPGEPSQPDEPCQSMSAVRSTHRREGLRRRSPGRCDRCA